MTDYSELVKALRIVEKEQDCNECEAGRWHHDFNCCLFADAAAAIEDMAKHITEMHERVTVLQIARGKLEEEVDALKHDIARAIQNNVNLLSEFQQISAENMMLKADVDAAYRH